MIKHRTLAQTVAAIALIAGSAGAQAAADGSRSGVGRWIAAQGNAALQQLHQDLRKDLSQRLQPILPDSAVVADAAAEPLIKVGNDADTAPAAATPNTALRSL